MSAMIAAVALPATGSLLSAGEGVSTVSGGAENVLFWVLAPVMVIAAMGLLFVRKAVHAALCMALVMVCLGMVYVALQAPFLGVVQIFVYTGAVMMLFLFVLMLVGVDSSDSLIETIKGQRVAATLLGLAFAVLLIGVEHSALYEPAIGLSGANADGNVTALAVLIFGPWVWVFEVTSALLITAAVGAMVLAHRERLEPKPTQASLAAQRMQDYAASGKHPGNLPTPGVFARHNAVDTPALLPDGTAAESSVSRVLAARGTVRSAPAMADDIAGIEKQLGQAPHAGRDQSAPATTDEEAPAT